jgi:hypothetical protein
MRKQLSVAFAFCTVTAIFVGFQNFSPSYVTAQQGSNTLSTLSDLGQQTRVAPNIIDTKGGIVRKISRSFKFDIEECKKTFSYQGFYLFRCYVNILDPIIPRNFIGVASSPRLQKKYNNINVTFYADSFNSYSMEIIDSATLLPGCLDKFMPRCQNTKLLNSVFDQIKNDNIIITVNGLYEAI